MNGHATALFIWPHPPLALGRGQKVKYHYTSISKPFQKLLDQTLCVFSQIKDIKHIEGNFHSVAWAMPQVWDLRVLGGGGCKNVRVGICSASSTAHSCPFLYFKGSKVEISKC